MPNWVRNNITIHRVDNNDVNVKDFCSLIGYNNDEDFTINNVIKEPPYPHFHDEEIGKEHILSQGRYNWRATEWGVKWDAVIIPKGTLFGVDYVNQINLSFDTAWTSPVSALIQLSKLLGEDYDVILEASDEFLGNHCDFSLKINDGDITEIPIEGDYEEWWNNVWGFEDYDLEDVEDVGTKLITDSNITYLTNNHSSDIDDILQSLLMADLVESDDLFIETGEGNLWELDTTYFTITVGYDKVKQKLLDCIVVYKTKNQPIGIVILAGSYIADRLSRSVLN